MPAANYEVEPLLTAYHFNYTQRPRRDKAWGLAYGLLLLVTIGWALVSLAYRPELLSVLASPAYLDDPSHCPLTLAHDDSTHGGPAATAPSTSAIAAVTAGPPEGLDIADGGSQGRRSVAAVLSASLTRAAAEAREALWPAAARRPPYRHPQYLPDPRTDAAGSSALPSSTSASASAATSTSTSATSDPTGSGASDSGGADYSSGSGGGDYGGSGVVSILDPGSGSGGLPRALAGWAGLTLAASLAAACCVGGLFLAALRHSPWALVMLAAGMQVGGPLASAFVASRAGHSSLALVLALTSAGLAVSLYCGRSSLRLASRLLGLAAAALKHNSPLLGVCAALQVCLGVAAAVLVACVAVVGSSGPLVANPLRGGNPGCATPGPGGQAVTCCALSPGASLPPYLAAAGLCLAWTVLLLFEIKVYVVSGVVAQWYFSPAGHLAGGSYAAGGAAANGGGGVGLGVGLGAAAGEAGGGGSTLGGCGYSCVRSLAASLGHAVGPSFGSLCCGSAVLGATAYPRAVARLFTRLRYGPLAPLPPPPGAALPGACCPPCCPPAPPPPPCCSAAAAGCCCWCLSPCWWPCCCCCGLAGWLGAALEQLTRFGTVVMSMGGQGFWAASGGAVALLRRNLMDAYGLWWYLPMILHCGAAAFAAAWGYAAYWLALAGAAAWPPGLVPGSGGATPLPPVPPLSAAAAAALGGLAAAAAALVLSFLVSVLTSASDALFICFVLDRDTAAVTWHDLHSTLAELPCCAAARAAAAEGHYVIAAAPYGGGGDYGTPPPPLVSYYYTPPLVYGAATPPAYGGPYGAPPAAVYHRVMPLPPPPPPLSGAPPAALPLPAPGYPIGGGYSTAAANGGRGLGFWGWLRSPGASSGSLYGMPVGGGGASSGGRYRSDRPQHPPPAVLSPPYSDDRFAVRPRVSSLPPMPPPVFGSPVRPS